MSETNETSEAFATIIYLISASSMKNVSLDSFISFIRSNVAPEGPDRAPKMPRRLSDGRGAKQIAPLTAKEADSARSTLQVLRALRPSSHSIEIRVANQGAVLPASVYDALLEILDMLSLGCGVRLVPMDDELTTEEASRMLGVSRPHLVKLLEKGALPFTKVGSRRRIRTADLVRYIELRDDDLRARRAEFDRLAARLRSQLKH